MLKYDSGLRITRKLLASKVGDRWIRSNMMTKRSDGNKDVNRNDVEINNDKTNTMNCSKGTSSSEFGQGSNNKENCVVQVLKNKVAGQEKLHNIGASYATY